MHFQAKGPNATNFFIDYLDIKTAQKFKILNPEAIDSDDATFQESYKYNLIIQIELTVINGLSGINSLTNQSKSLAVLNEDQEIMKRSDLAIATVFLQVKHMDLQNKYHLVNERQELILDYLLQRIAS